VYVTLNPLQLVFWLQLTPWQLLEGVGLELTLLPLWNVDPNDVLPPQLCTVCVVVCTVQLDFCIPTVVELVTKQTDLQSNFVPDEKQPLS
jgi:hypothetical protein